MVFSSEWSPLTTALVLGVVTLVCIKIWQSYRYLTTFKRMGIPGPTPLPMLGNSHTLSKKPFADVFLQWGKEFGKTYGIFFPVPTLMISDMELIREILIKKFHCFANRTDFFFMKEDDILKDNLMTLTGDHWRHVRSQLSPTFSSTKLKQMVPAIERVARNLHSCLKDKAAKGEDIELKDLCSKVTMDIIAGVAFGLHVDSLKDNSDPFYQHAQSMIKSSSRRMPLFLMFPWLGRLLVKLGFSPFSATDTKYLVTVIDSALKERQENPQSRGDFLQLLVDAQKMSSEQGQVDNEIDFTQELQTSSTWTRKGLTQSEMYANAIVFLFAGNDTVATIMSVALFTLAANPECLRKAQQEVDDVVGKSPLTYNSAMSLNYIDMCMNETIRLNLPGFIDRVTSEDVDIGGHHLTKGWKIGIPSSVLHRDPDLWADPLTFDPERFTAEAKAARPAMAFLPFGMGPRNCIGMRLAQLEIRFILASVLRSFTPVLCHKSVYPPYFKPMTFNARDGMWVKLEPRKDLA